MAIFSQNNFFKPSSRFFHEIDHCATILKLDFYVLQPRQIKELEEEVVVY